jgi:hypothetical protein
MMEGHRSPSCAPLSALGLIRGGPGLTALWNIEGEGKPFPAEAMADVFTDIPEGHSPLEQRIEIYDLFPSLWNFPPTPIVPVSDARCLTEESAMLSQLSPKTLRALENDVQALRLRIAGNTFEEIALALGYRSKSSAWKAVLRAKTRRLIELARLVPRLERAEIARQGAALERRIKARSTTATRRGR